MYSQSIRLGRILGIPVGVNYSWFLAFALIAVSLTTQFAHIHPEWNLAEQIFLGAVTTILFFVSVLLHELAHSILALNYRIPVQSITLFIFGGVASITREPEKPMHEFNIAIAGPAMSALLGLFFVGTASLFEGISEGLAAVGEWLGYINLMLALFNLIPGFPLDGGRVLRSAIWKYTGNFVRATSIAAKAGQFFAYAFILFGVWQAVMGNFFGGLWIGFIGWFLLNAAQSTSAQASLRNALRGNIASDVMTTDCLRISGQTTVADLAENYLLKSGSRCALVTDGDQFRGLVTLHEIKAIPKTEWNSTQLQDVMVGVDELLSAEPDTPLDLVLQTMNSEDVSQVPVIAEGKLVGMVGRDRLLALVQTRIELKL